VLIDAYETCIQPIG